MHISSPLGEGLSLLPRQLSNDSLCTTEGCIFMSNLLKNGMNFNINPCDDFYEYACGNWINNEEIPPSQDSVGTVRELMNRNLDGVSEVLSESFDQFVDRVRKDNPEGLGLLAGQEDADRVIFNKMKGYYDSCMNQDIINSRGVAPLYKDISELFTDMSYSQCTDEEPFDGNNVVRFTDVLINLKEKGVGAFIKFESRPDLNNNTKSLFLLDDPPVVFATEAGILHDLYNKNKTMNEYHVLLSNLAKSVLGKPKDTSAIETKREKDMQLYKISALSDEEIDEMVTTFIRFEKKIVSMTYKVGTAPSSGDVFKDWTLEQANKEYPVVDWERYLRHFLPPNAPMIDEVTAKIPDTLINIGKWLSNNNTFTLQQNATSDDIPPTFKEMREYLSMLTILSKASVLPEPIYSQGDIIIGKLVKGSSEAPIRSRVCTDKASNAFKDVMGRFFAVLKFGGEPQRLKAERLISNLLKTWRGKLETNNWLDAGTLKNALEKVDKAIHAEGYNIISPDMRNATLLKEKIADIDMSPTDFYENNIQSNRLETRENWSAIGKPVNKNKWLMPAFTVNAYYAPSMNTIVIPAGLLQVPMYDWDLPDYLNYGGIGGAIGHEIMHGYDSQGRNYDGDGNFKDWWTEETTDAFFSRAFCIYQQYGEFTVPDLDGGLLNINPLLTLAENLADNGGTHLGWSAYKQSSKTSLKSTLRLPGLEQLTPDQLFFVNFANMHCAKTRPEALVAQVMADSHAPGNVRVTGTLRNTPEFAEAFNCPLGSPMNPPGKCNIW